MRPFGEHLGSILDLFLPKLKRFSFVLVHVELNWHTVLLMTLFLTHWHAYTHLTSRSLSVTSALARPPCRILLLPIAIAIAAAIA